MPRIFYAIPKLYSSFPIRSRRSKKPPPTPTCRSLLQCRLLQSTSMEPTGTIIFSSLGRAGYGFDIFSVKLPASFDDSRDRRKLTERCLTDGVSVNFNGQFVDEEESLTFISERSGSAQVFLTRHGLSKPERLPSAPGSFFHDRPIVKGQRLYFISAHEKPDKPIQCWNALYSTPVEESKIIRLTPPGYVDYSPAIFRSGKFVAVASYGSRSWEGEFHELRTDIVVFPESDPNARVTVCQHGGWPTWSGDSTIYFHRRSNDGWWSIFRVDLSPELSEAPFSPSRVTPPGIHCVTPTAMHNANKIAIATRRRGYRHIEVYDIASKTFHPITELLNPNFHCYNPFFSPGSTFLGYHRFRGKSAKHGESIIPYLDRVSCPVPGLKMFRLNGDFPSFSPAGDLIAYNPNLESRSSGLNIIKSDGSKKWVLFKDRVAFYVSWSPAENNVIFTSIGPIFASGYATVHIARVSFDPANLTDNREEIPVEIKILTAEGTRNNAFPSCSPDGKFIVFRSGRSGNKNLYIMDAVRGEFNGGSIRQLTNGRWIDTMPSWSPDGKLIAFSSNMGNPADSEHFGIYVIRPDGSGLRRIHLKGLEDPGDFHRERINHICWSADCEWLLFTANLSGVTAEPVSIPHQFQPFGEMFIVRLDGSELKRLTWDGYENGTATWIPGGVELVFDRDRWGNLTAGNVAGDSLTGDFNDNI